MGPRVDAGIDVNARAFARQSAAVSCMPDPLGKVSTRHVSDSCLRPKFPLGFDVSGDVCGGWLRFHAIVVGK